MKDISPHAGECIETREILEMMDSLHLPSCRGVYRNQYQMQRKEDRKSPLMQGSV